MTHHALDNRIGELLRELKAGLEALYEERLGGLYLYGSQARGEQDAESDVDVLVVLDHITRYAAEVDRTGQLVAHLSLKYGVSVSRVFISQEDWVARQSPFLANASEEAIPV